MRRPSLAWFAFLSAAILFWFSTSSKTRAAQGTPSAIPPNDISGVWNSKPGAPNPGPMVPKDVSLTPWGQAKYVAAGNGKGAGIPTDPYESCDPMGPTRWSQYVHPFEAVQIPGRIFFFYEISHFWRTIYMDGRPVLKNEDMPFGPTYMGYSVGHWDKGDLVIDTVGMNDKTWLDAFGHIHSEALHLTERYHSPNHDTLEMTYTFDDPKAYTKSWTFGPKIFQRETGPKWEIQESYCTLEDQKRFSNSVTDPLNAPK